MMSVQQTRPQQSISQAQSTAVVQTLLKAGLGCITFLRYKLTMHCPILAPYMHLGISSPMITSLKVEALLGEAC